MQGTVVKEQEMQSCCKQGHAIYKDYDGKTSYILCDICGFFMEEDIPLVQLQLKWKGLANARVFA